MVVILVEFMAKDRFRQIVCFRAIVRKLAVDLVA